MGQRDKSPARIHGAGTPRGILTTIVPVSFPVMSKGGKLNISLNLNPKYGLRTMLTFMRDYCEANQ